MRLTLLVAVALAVLATPAAAAPLQQLGLFDGFVSASDRHVTWTPSSGTTRVLDTATGTTADYADPSGCDRVAIAGKRLLYACRSQLAFPIPAIVDPRSREELRPFSDIGIVHRYSSLESISWYGVGRHWLASSMTGYHWSATTYWNWRTGTSVGDDAAGRRRVADLDRRTLFTSLCRPLVRPRAPDLDYEASDSYRPLAYRRPWALLNGERVRVRRCGAEKPVTLCATSCGGRSLGARGRVAWVRGRRLHVRRLGPRQHRSWRLPGGATPQVPWVTRDAVVVGVGDRLLLARLGRR